MCCGCWLVGGEGKRSTLPAEEQNMTDKTQRDFAKKVLCGVGE